MITTQIPTKASNEIFCKILIKFYPNYFHVIIIFEIASRQMSKFSIASSKLSEKSSMWDKVLTIQQHRLCLLLSLTLPPTLTTSAQPENVQNIMKERINRKCVSLWSSAFSDLEISTFRVQAVLNIECKDLFLGFLKRPSVLYNWGSVIFALWRTWSNDIC